jgi:alpha-N-arabinofuranosidase
MTASAMRQLDPSVQLVAGGSSGRQMPTFGDWERVVLGHAYDEVDYISCHAYYEEKDGDVASFLASGVDMDRYIESVVATADHVKAVKRSSKSIDISFDEWNVWYQERYQGEKATGIGNWPVAPRILEDRYNVTDAVVVGGLLISLLKHADRVTSASIAQLVNVIAPIMTEPGGPAWRQTTFHPFAQTAARAQGTSLKAVLEADTLETAQFGEVPALDAAATIDGDGLSVFLVNRHQTEAAKLTIDVAALGASGSPRAVGIWDDDRFASNTLEDRNRVTLRDNPTARRDGDTITVTLPPMSWTALTLG